MVFAILVSQSSSVCRSLRRVAGRLAVCCGMAGLIMADGVRAAPEVKAPQPSVTMMAYVAEVPYQLNPEIGNPLEIWSRNFGSVLSSPVEQNGERVKNLVPLRSLEAMGKLSRTRTDHLFAIQGYEFVRNRESARMDALLTPALLLPPGETKENPVGSTPVTGAASPLRPRTASVKTEFIILRQKKPGQSQKFNMVEFLHSVVLVDRAGCGELVYRWLDCKIAKDTGDGSRENLADFRTAANAEEAILAVYFREVAACVVSREDWEEALRYNPRGLKARLEEADTSPVLLRHVIACPSIMPKVRRQNLTDAGANVRISGDKKDWVLAPLAPDDLKTLEELQREWDSYFGGPGKTEARPDREVPVPPRAPGAVPPPVSATRAPERRPL